MIPLLDLRREPAKVAAALIGAALALSCGEAPTGTPDTASSTSLGPAVGADAAASSSSCVTPADHTVADPSELAAAVAEASPGDVIAVDGTLHLDGPVGLRTEELTLTCASPGDGLVLADDPAFPRPFAFVGVFAPDVTVQGLTLDVTPDALDRPNISAMAALTTGDLNPRNAAGVRLVGNHLRCGNLRHACIRLNGVVGGALRDNTIEVVGRVFDAVNIAGDYEGLDSPDKVDGDPRQPAVGTEIVGNTIRTTDAVPTKSLSGPLHSVNGLFLWDAEDLTVRDNRVTGQWFVGIHGFGLDESLVERNRVRLDRSPANPPHGVGFLLSGYDLFAVEDGVDDEDNVVRANSTTGDAFVGFAAVRACDNGFVGNRAESNRLAGAFLEPSGDNTWVGSVRSPGGPGGGSAPDFRAEGNRDCDGDGRVDPNAVTGVDRSDLDVDASDLVPQR